MAQIVRYTDLCKAFCPECDWEYYGATSGANGAAQEHEENTGHFPEVQEPTEVEIDCYGAWQDGYDRAKDKEMCEGEVD